MCPFVLGDVEAYNLCNTPLNLLEYQINLVTGVTAVSCNGHKYSSPEVVNYR
jgi:hypothetical protein